MKSLWKMTRMEAKLFLREPVGVFFTLIFPLLVLFLFGSIYGNDPTPFFGGYGSVDVSVPAYLAMIIATTGMLGLTITVAGYREQGILRRLRTTPIRPLTILAAQVIVFLAMTLFGAMLLVLVGKLVYQMRFEGNVFSVLLAFILSALSFFAFGFLLASLAPTARTAQVVGMALFYPMLFLSGAAIPREILPATVREFSLFLPLTHVVTLLRGLWLGQTWAQHRVEVLILAGILVLSTLISAWVFRWE